jgi:hypothetical protein
MQYECTALVQAGGVPGTHDGGALAMPHPAGLFDAGQEAELELHPLLGPARREVAAAPA